MNEQKNINSVGENTDSAGDFAYSVRTARTRLNAVLSFNRLVLAARRITTWLRTERSTQGERGA